MLPAPESFATTEARELHGNLKELLQDMWSFDDIPDAMLVAIYLNPACAAQNMLDRVELPDKTKLRDKAKELTMKALVSFKEEQDTEASQKRSEGREVTGKASKVTGEMSSQPSKFTRRYFNLQAAFAVKAYDLQVMENPQQYAGYMEAPQAYWQTQQESPELKDLAQVARSCLSIQATSTESERLFSKAGQVLSARKTQMTDHNFRNIIFARSYERVLPLIS
ncbi:hypothetical protein BG003_000717 [Podila horticola]|nr:hypothetical protein BG003_000717 [Podila horticola]